MATIVAAAGGGNWNATTTWTGGVVPTAADDVQLDATSGNVTINAAAACRSLDCTGYTGTLTHNSAITLSIGDATAGAGNVALKLVSGMTYTLGNASTSAISFISTSTTQQTITTGGKTLGNWTVNGAGSSYLLTDSNTVGSTASATLTTGTLNTNGQTCVWGAFNVSGSGTRTVTLGASSITLTNGAWNANVGTNLTVNPGTSTITLTANNAFFQNGGNTGTKNYYNLVFSGAGTKTYQGQNGASFNGFTVTGTLSLHGNSATNRLLVQSSALGQARTITVTGATVTASNADFRDMTLSAPTDLSAITGGSGDCGGNSNITFTTAATQYWQHGASASYNWSDSTRWFLATNGGGGAGRVPLPQDDVIFDANSFSTTGRTVVADMPRIGKSISWAGITNAPTLTHSTGVTMYGSLTLAAGMTYTSNSQSHTFEGRGSFTLTSAGKSFSHDLTMSMIGGTLTLLDDVRHTGSSTNFNIINGTFDANDFNVTATTLNIGGSTRTCLMRSGTWTLTKPNNNVWFTGSLTGLTLNPGTSTIVIADTGSSTKTFAGGGVAFNNLIITAGGTGSVVISGSNTFNQVTITAPKTVTFTAGTTQTMSEFTAVGSTGNVITITSSSNGSTATLSKASGIVTSDYLSLRDSTATGGATWYAGANSTNVSNNTGWIFTAAPSRGNNLMLLGIGS